MSSSYPSYSYSIHDAIILDSISSYPGYSGGDSSYHASSSPEERTNSMVYAMQLMASGCGDKAADLEKAIQELLASKILSEYVVSESVRRKYLGDQITLPGKEFADSVSREGVHMAACLLSSK